jgi:ABC-type transporter Mla subunit MlaD
MEDKVRALSFWTGVMVPIVAMGVGVTIVWAALYGSAERSRRAFRLLRYAISLLRKTGRR